GAGASATRGASARDGERNVIGADVGGTAGDAGEVPIFDEQVEGAAGAERRIAHHQAARRVIDVGIVSVAGRCDVQLAGVNFEPMGRVNADCLTGGVELQR